MSLPILAVIDTNVLVAGFRTKNGESPTVQIIRHIINQDIIPVLHKDIMAEYQDVLFRPHLKLDLAKVIPFLELVNQIGVYMNPTQYPYEMIDPDDRIFYEISLTGDSYLVTGNQKHYPISPLVVTPVQMIAILSSLK